MKIYKVDTKETVWHRSEYQVEDDVTPEQLAEMIANYEIEAVDYEGYMYETAENMTPNENGGCSTMEICVNTDKHGYMPIWGNGNENYEKEED